jgi:hypothetical protein
MNTKPRVKTKNPARVKIKRHTIQGKQLKLGLPDTSMTMLGVCAVLNLVLTVAVLALLVIYQVQPHWLSFSKGGDESASAILPNPNSLILETVKGEGVGVEEEASAGGQWIDDTDGGVPESGAPKGSK